MKKKGGYGFLVLWISLLMLTAGCGATTEGINKYYPHSKKEYSAVSNRARYTKKSDSWLQRHGYILVGEIGVFQHYKRCHEDCETYRHKRNIYQLMADLAAKKGGHLVKIASRPKKYTDKKLMKTGNCIRWKKKKVRVEHTTYKGGEVGSGTVRERTTRYTTEYKKVCAQYEKIYRIIYYRWGAVFIWRKVN